jgi:hypothetical protein
VAQLKVGLYKKDADFDMKSCVEINNRIVYARKESRVGSARTAANLTSQQLLLTQDGYYLSTIARSYYSF